MQCTTLAQADESKMLACLKRHRRLRSLLIKTYGRNGGFLRDDRRKTGLPVGNFDENQSEDSFLSGASLCGSNHSLFYTLSAVQVFETLVLKDINIEFLHDLQDNIETLEEAIHRDTKHTVGSGTVDSAKYGGVVLIRCRLCWLNSV